MWISLELVAATAVSAAALGGVTHDGGTNSSIAVFDERNLNETIVSSGGCVHHYIDNFYGEGVPASTQLQGHQHMLIADIVFSEGLLQAAYRSHFSLDTATRVTLDAGGDVSSTPPCGSKGGVGPGVLATGSGQTDPLSAGDDYMILLEDWPDAGASMVLQCTEVQHPAKSPYWASLAFVPFVTDDDEGRSPLTTNDDQVEVRSER